LILLRHSLWVFYSHPFPPGIPSGGKAGLPKAEFGFLETGRLLVGRHLLHLLELFPNVSLDTPKVVFRETATPHFFRGLLSVT
jgi:hypothetical protein